MVKSRCDAHHTNGLYYLFPWTHRQAALATFSPGMAKS
jgi:hypothetical protein